MIAKLTTGKSFKGAANYLLHDKGASTKDRVAWTESYLLPQDPETAVRLLTYWTMNQQEIKKRAGQSLGGRKLEKSVVVISLSWHPEENPSQDHMMETARSMMKSLEWDHLPFLAICHNDEPQPHIHLLIGRVSPENGLAASLWRRRTWLSNWCYEYEKKVGQQIYCKQREQNVKLRRQGKTTRYRDPTIAEAFEQSRNLKEFAAKLNEQGYELAIGRRLLVVDRWGKKHNPNRYLDKAERLRLKQWQAEGDMSQLRRVEQVKRHQNNSNDNVSLSDQSVKLVP